MKIEIITHFATADKNCSCDYYSVDVKIAGKIVNHYGDAYHEKGEIRAKEFVEGIKFALPNETFEIKHTHKADGKL